MMMRRVAILLAWLSPGIALAQSIPPWMTFGTVPSISQWQTFAASKQDVLNNNVIQLLTIAPNNSGGPALLNGNPIVGDCLQWSAAGILDAGAACGTGGGGGGGVGALPATVSGANPGGIAYFPNTTHMASSPTLTSSQLMVGGGSGNPPRTFVPSGGDATFSYPSFAVSSISGVPPGPLYGATSVNLGTQVTANLAPAHLDSGFNSDTLHCFSGNPLANSAWIPCSGATNFSIPTNPLGTASTNFVMMGLGTLEQMTPKKGGNVLVSVSGSIANSASGTCAYTLYYGTGAPPANGALPPNGAVQLGASIPSPGTSVLSANGVGCFSSIGTVYWIDLAVRSAGGGTCSPANISFSSIEN